MQALVLEDSTVAVRDVPVPEPGAGEALVRVQMAGVCNTDVEIARGYMGFSGVLGHELYGVVEACEDNPALVGKRVAGEINQACAACPMCERGLGRHCPARTVMGILHKDGCFAEHVTLQQACLHPLPEALEDARACFVEPTAAAFEVLEQVPVSDRDRIAVLGDGKLGLLIGQVLATTGATPTLVGRHERKLSLARAQGARTAALDALDDNTFDVVIEATGSPAGMEAAIRLTRPRGTLVLKSTYHGPLELDAAPLVIDELTVVGSRCGPFEPALRALATGAVDPDAMVDAIYPLAQAAEALERAQQPGVLKVLLDMR
ncbi:MAG: alcohol dehydrogenase catalytic domain-containing protein [Myxococcales bacterium]|nr:alcohol dehydrogenase catalytic domain-containing protein [Myxococcales bacterium]